MHLHNVGPGDLHYMQGVSIDDALSLLICIEFFIVQNNYNRVVLLDIFRLLEHGWSETKNRRNCKTNIFYKYSGLNIY